MVCLVLLSATFLNYANRFTVTQNAPQIQEAFNTDQAGYGDIAGWFSLGFACGGLTFGILADVVSVRILYPLVLLAWSIAGISSGMVETLGALKLAQFFLGLFEAGHWPCALRTTQRVFLPEQRTWANSLLQSGASLGAIATPLLVAFLLRWPDQWRLVFFIVGGLGLPWGFWWLRTIKETDVRRPVIQTDEAGAGGGSQLQEIPFWMVFTTRRWWILLFVVVCINTLWHYIRVWMPLTLKTDHDYDREFVQYFTSVYYLATFFGAMVAGWLTIRLGKRGGNVHRARMTTFLIFALLSTFSIPAAFLSKGPFLLGALLIVAFGSLGLFPIYYSLNQEISAKNQGKVGGSLGFSTWSLLFLVHRGVGRAVEANPDVRPWLFASVGLGPLLAFVALALFWGKRPTVETGAPIVEAE
jgi:ACS family hexuronate transporter-like MFS transporter